MGFRAADYDAAFREKPEKIGQQRTGAARIEMGNIGKNDELAPGAGKTHVEEVGSPAVDSVSR